MFKHKKHFVGEYYNLNLKYVLNTIHLKLWNTDTLAMTWSARWLILELLTSGPFQPSKHVSPHVYAENNIYSEKTLCDLCKNFIIRGYRPANNSFILRLWLQKLIRIVKKCHQKNQNRKFSRTWLMSIYRLKDCIQNRGVNVHGYLKLTLVDTDMLNWTASIKYMPTHDKPQLRSIYKFAIFPAI